MMNEQQKLATQKRNDAKTLLSALRWTTTVGAVSLTLAGWGLLSQAEALNAARAAESLPAEVAAATSASTAQGIAPGAITQFVSNIGLNAAGSAQSSTDAALSALLPTPTSSPAATATSAPTATPLPTATPAATATPTKLYTLDITQWVTNSNGDPWAVVRDDSGVLWYVWGPDVERLEQGLEPEVQPQPVNTTARSRGS